MTSPHVGHVPGKVLHVASPLCLGGHGAIITEEHRSEGVIIPDIGMEVGRKKQLLSGERLLHCHE